MIAHIIRWSIQNRPLVLLLTLLFIGWGIFSLMRTPLDAIPDLSDLQVIIKTSYPGQAPEVVEDQVTYPITTAMLSVPGTVAVRGFSFFGDSYVYVIFEDGTDIYWARSRVLEYLSQVASNLPNSAKPQLGPDATGVGWVYEYALVDRTGGHNLSQLRSLQDWFLKYELQTVAGVAEVATIGGMVKQYQVVLDPDKLRIYGIPLEKVRKAIQRANQEVGGSVIEQAEAEYMIRARGYLKNVEDLRQIPVSVNRKGTPILLDDIADIRLGPQMRRGIAELNGEGEVVGAIVVMRWGENALDTIKAVKLKLDQLKNGLPDGVEIVETYDRSILIERAVKNLGEKLAKEFLIVALVCIVFLFHLRSAFIAIIILPISILIAFIIMQKQGISANIMSLGGIAIAIGAMVDAAIVMIENAHKHMEREPVTKKNRWEIIAKSTIEVGPALFFSLLIITLSFLPVFTLEAQEGKLFSPLAFTKTYAMAAAAGLSITLMPVLMGYFIRGHIMPEEKNILRQILVAIYMPVIHGVLRFPIITILLSVLTVVSIYYPMSKLGSEFMPELDEGDLLYMPTAFTGISVGKAGELLQLTDKLIRTIPEVLTVFGKVGRAETATDPAPLTMIETTIQLRPKSEWREGMTLEKLKQDLQKTVAIPGLTNSWVMPIKTRIDMISTGVKTPLGIKISGPDLVEIQKIGQEIEKVIKEIPGTLSVFSERVAGARYIDIDIDRRAAARFGLNIADIQEVISTAVGGSNVTQTVEGLERYPVNMRYPRAVRDSVDKLRQLPIVTPNLSQVALHEVAEIRIVDGPGMIKSENARRIGWVYVDIKDRDLGGYVVDAQKAVEQNINLPAGYSVGWSGQYEYMLRAKAKLAYVVPLTLAIIFLLLYLNFRNFTECFMVMGSVPLALVGGVWLVYALDYNLSVAVGVGFVALAGVAAEFGVIMLVYLNQAIKDYKPSNEQQLREAIIDGAVLRVRPKAMSAAVVIAGLIPIMMGSGAGSEVMQRIAAPMLGGMITAPLVSMVLIPVLYMLWKSRQLKALAHSDSDSEF
ncbi:MAG: efflux RND transporter permease subunit [Gammaproteobacteria bacterium]|nr:efflux RND transporter permease subunit [Gammaproteobacteria bacterium]